MPIRAQARNKPSGAEFSPGGSHYRGGVFWINAAEPLLQGFAGLSRLLYRDIDGRPFDQQAHAAFEALIARPDPLVVLDNLAAPAEPSRPVDAHFTPAGLACRLLFTTRRRDLGRFRAIEISVLPERPALELVPRHESRRAALDPAHAEHRAARDVAVELGRLPLALEIAGAFLGEWPNISLADFRDRLTAKGCLATLDDGAKCLSASNP